MNGNGAEVTMHQHYITTEEGKRVELDSQVESYEKGQVIGNSLRRVAIKRSLAQIVTTEANMKVYDDILKTLEAYIDCADRSVKTCNCCGKRRSCCYFFHSIYGEDEQMGNVLAKNFDGEHRWITDEKHNPGVQIDAMFFTSSAEKPDDDNPLAKYKGQPAIIMCNPNAMFY